MESEITSTIQICLPCADHDEKLSTRCDVLIYNQIQMHLCVPSEKAGESLTTAFRSLQFGNTLDYKPILEKLSFLFLNKRLEEKPQ